MHRLILASLMLVMTAASAPAQTLAHSLPADALIYFRQTNPLATFQKVAGNSLLWKSPADLQKDFLDGIDSLMAMGDSALGIELGSISTYLRSVQSWEGALYRLELTDGMPEFEFALVFTTPMAEQIYKLLSGKLIEEQLGEELSANEMEVSLMGMSSFGLNVAQHGEQVIIADSRKRLNETMKTFGSVVPGSLAQSPKFQAAVGEDWKDSCFYGRLDFFLNLLKEESGRFMRGGGEAMSMNVATALGFFKLAALGYVEGDKSSRLAVLGSETIPVFDILAADGGTPDMLHLLPADTAFGFAWCGDTINLWKKGSAFLLDPAKFPLAARVEEGLRSFQKTTGLKIEEMAAVATGGMAFGFIPDENGRLDNRPENFILAIRTPDGAKAKEMLLKLGSLMTQRRGGEIEAREDTGVTWYSYKRGAEATGAVRELPVVAVATDLMILGTEPVIRKVMGIRSGQYPSLAAVAATRGLKPGAAAYWYAGLKSILGQESTMTSGYHAMKDGAGVAGAIEIVKDRVVVTTNQPLGQVLNGVAVGALMEERQATERRAVLADLRKIAEAYRLYRGEHNKDPLSLSDLGFTGEKALLYPPNRPQGDPGKPYVLIPVGAVGKEDESRTVIAQAPDTALGRLVATLDGESHAYSEARFKRLMAEQQRRLQTPPAPPPGK